MIDKYSHALDWERAVYDTIMLDNAVSVAKRFAAERNDTLIIVVADHAHPVSIIGTYDDERPGERLRDKLGIYAEAKFPNYPKADADGYPRLDRRVAAARLHVRRLPRPLRFGQALPHGPVQADGGEGQARRWPTRSTARRRRRACRAICPSASRRACTRPTMSCSPPWALERSCSKAASTTRACSA